MTAGLELLNTVKSPCYVPRQPADLLIMRIEGQATKNGVLNSTINSPSSSLRARGLYALIPQSDTISAIFNFNPSDHPVYYHQNSISTPASNMKLLCPLFVGITTFGALSVAVPIAHAAQNAVDAMNEPSTASQSEADLIAANFDACKAKNLAVYSAIYNFCKKMDIRVPSDYASKGAVNDPEYDDKPHKWGVAINGDCGEDSQRVPQFWCQKQFMEMCASGGDEGGSVATYEGCQRWIIPTRSDLKNWPQLADK